MLDFNIDTLSGIEFEKVCQMLVEKMGFTTQTTKASGDGGIDLIAYNHQPFLSGKYIIQCKRYAGSVGEPIIRDLYGVVTSERANKGILMTTGHFTKSAVAFATGKPIELIDGVALKNLLLQYGMEFSQNNQTNHFIDVTNGKDIAEVIQENWMLEDDYDEFMSLRRTAKYTDDEIELAEYINWLIDKSAYDNMNVCDHSERVVFLREVNENIVKYLKIRRNKKSKLLSYLYRLIYVQNCILLERFTDAKKMFIELMKNEDIQFNVFETLGESHKTAEIFDNSGVFSFLYATWCNMNQIAFITQDDALRDYLGDHNLFFGVSSIQEGRLKEKLQMIEDGKSDLNPLYFQKQLQLIDELRMGFDNEIKMHIFFRVDQSEVVQSFFNYAYYGGATIDLWIGFADYVIEKNEMAIWNYGNISIDNALSAYIPFSQNDLL